VSVEKRPQIALVSVRTKCSIWTSQDCPGPGMGWNESRMLG